MKNGFFFLPCSRDFKPLIMFLKCFFASLNSALFRCKILISSTFLIRLTYLPHPWTHEGTQITFI